MMRKITLLSLVLYTCFSSVFGQVEFVGAPYDLGLITKAGVDYLDIPIKNTSSKKVFLFRTDADNRFQINYSSTTILPDSIIFMRVLFTPQEKGVIDEKLAVHFSCFEEPTILKLSGFVEEVPKESGISCPSFAQQSVNTSLEHPFTVKVVDELTGKVLVSSNVSILRNGVIFKSINTKKSGVYSQDLMLGYYYFIGSHEGYENGELGAYVNRINNNITIPLRKMEIEEDEIVVVIEGPEDDEVIEEEIVIVPPNIIEDTLSEVVESVDEEELYPDFSMKDYKPNNVVFLVDVSSSMNQGGRLDLLKASMIELTSMLRPVDKITVVSYASKANLILETTSGDDVDSLVKLIEGLEAKGYTAGGKGMQLAYSMACNAFIPEGNNQIIMATDGAFNSGDENVNKLAKKYSRKGVKVSVVGIKNRDVYKKVMGELAVDGQGNYINILDYEMAKQSLVSEIKQQSSLKP